MNKKVCPKCYGVEFFLLEVYRSTENGIVSTGNKEAICSRCLSNIVRIAK